MSQSLQSINFSQLTARDYTASPSAWEDRVFYFLLLDRFSDNREAGFAPGGTTPLYNTSDNGNAVKNEGDALAWRTAGSTWTGGTIKGVTSKIPYLADMGVNAIWISPVFKQVSFQNTYHGYGIQDFLEVDPHFGSLEDLQELVRHAHAADVYIILDIIVNHTGNVFSYDADRYPVSNDGHTTLQPRWDGNSYRVKGFNNSAGQPDITFDAHVPAGPDDAIWPLEFRDPAIFSQKGPINNWDYDPEFLEGDFFDLKDIHLGTGHTDTFSPSPGLLHLVDVYKYWMGVLDIDGYRIDTVKHMETGAVRFFASSLHEFAQCLGKDKFFLIGEITGDRQFAFYKMQAGGIDAALGIADVQNALGDMVKGLVRPETFFDLFRNSLLIDKGSHTWFRDKVVVMVDDHDKVNQGNNKYRFSAKDEGARLMLNAIATNLTTIGIPCIYYGSEQLFDGNGTGDGADKYIRETMFGGPFGAFRSRDRHFFDVSGEVYQEVAKICTVRRRFAALRRGRQYLRPISGDGLTFGMPSFVGGSTRIRSVIAWSRLLDAQEFVVATNTDTENDLSVWVTIDSRLHKTGDVFTCIYPDQPLLAQTSVEDRNGNAILIKVPAAGFVIYRKEN